MSCDLEKSILERIDRIKRGGQIRVLDLFSGCGGLSLGFHSEGFKIVGAVEFDRHAAASHGANFHAGESHHSLARDITTTSPEQLASELNLGPVRSAVDIIVGGPPCQAFARVGRSKLREIAEHPNAFRQDPRARLYLDYLKYVSEFQPLCLVMENVPDVLNHGGQNIAEETREYLDSIGYTTNYTLLNAAYFGVPQMRERMILVAYKKELDLEVSFPNPTHYIELPTGYTGSRQVALRHLKSDLLDPVKGYVSPEQPNADQTFAVTAAQAIGDLPKITAHLEGKVKRGARRFDQVTKYDMSPINEYQRLMRQWPDFENEIGIFDHVIRYLPRDWKLFGRLKPGDQYPEAHAVAMEMFQEALQKVERESGGSLEQGSAQWETLKASIVPPYDTTKFPNKWRKMEPNLPARTLMAHLGKDSYSHIHYDDTQARTISVREAARLQSFPDGFKFCGAMNAAFRQIGNAVPPLLSKAVANEIAGAFSKALGKRKSRTKRLVA